MTTLSREGEPAHENEVKAWHDTHYSHTSPETKRSAWQRFENLQDPYNTDNFLTGWVQMTGGDEYGSLVIEEVNELPASQRIPATPKTSYPYRRDRSWLLNSAEWIRSSLKYDGTNICQYSYEDTEGRRFVTFKLRTRPFVPARFRVMLDHALRRYPATASLQPEPGESMIYELYGRQNPMLIIYPQGIELTALCRRNPETGDMEPADRTNPAFGRLDCPVAEATPAAGWENIRQEYLRRQGEYSRGLTATEVNGEKTFHGHEGEMLYVHFRDGSRTKPGSFTRLIKLKPVEIEEIHQALDHVPKEEIEATVRNVWEVSDTPGLNHLVALLSEDWSEDQIRRSMDTIQRALDEAVERREYEEEILMAFHSEFTADQFRNDRAAVMRELSGKYPKSAMQRIYGILDARLPQGT